MYAKPLGTKGIAIGQDWMDDRRWCLGFDRETYFIGSQGKDIAIRDQLSIE